MTVKERKNEVDFGKVVDTPSRWPLKWDNGASAIGMNKCVYTGILWVRNWTNIQINIPDPIYLCLSRIRPTETYLIFELQWKYLFGFSATLKLLLTAQGLWPGCLISVHTPYLPTNVKTKNHT